MSSASTRTYYRSLFEQRQGRLQSQSLPETPLLQYPCGCQRQVRSTTTAREYSLVSVEEAEPQLEPARPLRRNVAKDEEAAILVGHVFQPVQRRHRLPNKQLAGSCFLLFLGRDERYHHECAGTDEPLCVAGVVVIVVLQLDYRWRVDRFAILGIVLLNDLCALGFLSNRQAYLVSRHHDVKLACRYTDEMATRKNKSEVSVKVRGSCEKLNQRSESLVVVPRKKVRLFEKTADVAASTVHSFHAGQPAELSTGQVGDSTTARDVGEPEATEQLHQ